jgi:histidyl-tRNA synthetase
VLLDAAGGKPADTKALTRQFIQAEKKGARWVIIPAEGAAQAAADGLTLRDLSTRQNQEGLSVHDVVEILHKEKGPGH